MKISLRLLILIVLTFHLTIANSLFAKPVHKIDTGKPDQVLVTVNNLQVTASELAQAVRSSPFATQFNTLDKNQQAELRGGLLQRLVAARLMLLEAQAQQLENTPQFKREEDGFRAAQFQRKYIEHLRNQLKIPDEIKKQMKDQFKGNYDAYKAAESAYIANLYKQARIDEIIRLRKRYNVKIYSDRISASTPPDAVLMQGDGMQIKYVDLPGRQDVKPTREWVEDKLYRRAELLMTSRAARDGGFDVSDEIRSFRRERLPSFLAEKLEKQWLPDETPLKAYYESHPMLGKLMERRHIGQLVVATREEAEALRKRILAGESLFALAGEYSIDPFGRSRNGDMGWIKEDRGSPVINKAIANLKDEEVSEVIKTPLGFHLVVILERKPGEIRPYHLVRDKVKQMYMAEKLDDYLKTLENKYQVKWHVLQNTQ